MSGFPMCEACAREYGDPADRRFHAQPVACVACGPRLALTDARGAPLATTGEAMAGAARLLGEGGILAVKGLGGFHLAARAADERAVAALRARKHREEKPFAIMAADLVAAARLARVGEEEARHLDGPRRPIVLLGRRPEAPLAGALAPGNRSVGIMLPYTPLHHLLLRALGEPLVLTSGNLSDEPIAYRDHDARDRLGGIATAFLTHDRAIHVRTDDSGPRGARDGDADPALPRLCAPAHRPRHPLARHVLACGGELKNTICVAKGRHAVLSHHIGDLEGPEALRSFAEAIGHFRRLFDVTPAVVAHDLHPEYLSTKWALTHAEVPLVGVQHHHAHVAACLADNGVDERVIGVAFDGTGYGTDGTLWGGEFLVADLAGFERVGHLAPVALPGGSAAIREPWRMAAMYLAEAFGADVPRLPVVARNAARWAAVLAVARSGVNAPRASSVGRHFDAVAALLDVRDRVSYEGQAAIELEQLADPAETGAYAPELSDAPGGFTLSGAALVRAAVEDRLAGTPAPVVAARFHGAIARAIVAGCRRVRESTGRHVVALSGGVFQNVRLLEDAMTRLEADDFRVLRHRQVPCNDGGISLGQALIADRTAP
jgi:hydrogenase maturation protein HypF